VVGAAVLVQRVAVFPVDSGGFLHVLGAFHLVGSLFSWFLVGCCAFAFFLCHVLVAADNAEIFIVLDLFRGTPCSRIQANFSDSNKRIPLHLL